MISRFFINRPIFAGVIAVAIVIAGLLALRGLPVKEYPNIVPPNVSVSAMYPGADPQTLLKSVAAPLEEAINGVKNMIYITSIASSDGSVNVIVTFKVGTDPDIAKIDVNNRVQMALNKLPEEVRRLGVVVRESSPDLLEFIAFTSRGNRRNVVNLANYVLINVLDSLKRIPGVGDAKIYGRENYSMRIWIEPDKLALYHLTVDDVIAAIKEQNNQYPVGKIAQAPMGNKPVYTYSVITSGRLKSVKQFENIVIRTNPDGSSLRLKDVARVELGSEGYSVIGDYNGKPMVPVGIFLSPGANALTVAKRVRQTLKELSKSFPPDITYIVPYDTTRFIKASIREVEFTFIAAIALVVFIIYLFLGSLRATLIPVLAIPVSLIGTFAGFWLFGFSINLLTLFGMILAIGLVVDDAIVVIENVDRIMKSEGLPSKEATIKAMGEITSPIIAIVLVLASVFVPASFVGGFSGKMYQQFAITIAISIVISGFVALSLTPALCALILRSGGVKPVAPIRLFNRLFERVTALFGSSVRVAIRLWFVALVIFAGILLASGWLVRMIPKGLVPEEDKGAIFVLAQLMPGYSVYQTEKVNRYITKVALKNPYVKSVASVAGFDISSQSLRPNASLIFLDLKDWSKRKSPDASSFAIAGYFMRRFYTYKKALVFAVNPPPIMGMSTTGGFDMYVQDRLNDDPEELAKYVNRLVRAANRSGKLMMVRTSLTTNTPRYRLVVDKQKALSDGVDLSSLYQTIAALYGSYYVNDFNLYGRVFHVNLEADWPYRESPQDYRFVFVRNNKGEFVPLSSLVKVVPDVGPDVLEHFNLFLAAHISGSPAFGYTSGDAIKTMEQLAHKILPAGFTISWSGSSYQQLKASREGNRVFIYVVIFVFMILAALYESLLVPFSIMLVVPFALFGAVVALFLMRLENDIYFQVGIITLIGLSAKNAILLVEFAIDGLKRGLTLVDAAVEAAKIRLRPIVMTSFAFIAGTLPLVLSSGAGANSRHIVGATVVGGMLLQTLIGTLFIPLFFWIVMRLAGKR